MDMAIDAPYVPQTARRRRESEASTAPRGIDARGVAPRRAPSARTEREMERAEGAMATLMRSVRGRGGCLPARRSARGARLTRQVLHKILLLSSA